MEPGAGLVPSRPQTAVIRPRNGMPRGQISLAHWRNIKHSLSAAPSKAREGRRSVRSSGGLAALAAHELG